jgi:hypothetical protein
VCGLAIMVMFTHSAVAAPRTSTFATPEAAVTHFVQRMAAADLDGALEAFAVDEYAAHFDFAKQARRLGSFMAGYLPAPARYRLYRRINALEAMRDAANRSLHFAVQLVVDESELTRSGPGMPDPRARAGVLATALAKIQPLRLVRIDQPRKSITRKPETLALFRDQAAPDGADDATERIALLELAGQHYQCGFRLFKYGNTWRIKDLTSYFASEAHSGLFGVEKVTPEAFDAATK